MPGHKDKRNNVKEDIQNQQWKWVNARNQMQTNAFNPMPTTSQAEIFRMNQGLQQGLKTLYESGIARKRADLAFLGIDDSMMSDTEVQNYIIHRVTRTFKSTTTTTEMREESFKTDRMLTEGLDEIIRR